MKLATLIFLALLAFGRIAGQETIDYFLPQGTSYDAQIPTPESFFGFQIGEYHLTHDKIVRYMDALDQISDKIHIIEYGKSYEKQPLLLVAITSPRNQQNLSRLREDHLASINPQSSPNTVRIDPLILWLGYSVHGNEPSGANAAPLIAYYLAAGQDNEISRILDETIILIDPCSNPDGLNRFAAWVNSRKSLHNNPDDNSIEFREGWPGSRSNHYWFDLNRDWLPLQNVESKGRITEFHRWKPHILTDHHEMGGNSTFFFQPGVASRSNPVVPISNYALTQKIGFYHSTELDQIGSLYYSEEVFDDFYFGKGSAYPDVNGGIGILFEQASSRGHLRITSNGPMSFAFTIRNQVKTSLSTIKASQGLMKELKYHQKEFFRTAWEEAQQTPIKGYVFGDPQDPFKTQLMIDNLLHHDIKVQSLKKPVYVNGVRYESETSYFVPTQQMQYRMVRTLFEKVTHFEDSTFYDVSTWTLPLAMGIPYSEVTAQDISRIDIRSDVTGINNVTGQITGPQSTVGYLFPSDPYLTHKALYELLNSGVRVKIAGQKFKTYLEGEVITFNPGTLFVPVQSQVLDPTDLYQLLDHLAHQCGLSVYSASSSSTVEGPDLGSGQFSSLEQPSVLCLVGSSISSRDVGEVWHLLDTRFSIPMTLADITGFRNINLDDYNTLVMGSGSYSEISEDGLDKLTGWIRGGGKIIAMKSAGTFLNRVGLMTLSRVKSERSSSADPVRPYANRRSDRVGGSIPGTIFLAHLDTTHPLGYGYHTDQVALFKSGTEFYELSDNPYENVALYTDEPLLSGYVNDVNLQLIKGSSAIQRQSYGRGSIIYFADDPVYRGYWTSQHKMLLNAIFWGDL